VKGRAQHPLVIMGVLTRPDHRGRDRERLVWNQGDVENQLRAIVQIHHPAVLHLFSSLDRDITFGGCSHLRVG
jgi:hypothetical protein